MSQGDDGQKGRYPSESFVILVEVIFAVVLGASLLQFHDVLFPPKGSTPSFWALCVVYVAAFTSWAGWHSSIHKHPYSETIVGRARASTDAFIVVVYAGLLFLASRADSSLMGYLWGFVLVFFLYMLSGIFRRVEYSRREASRTKLIVKHLAMMVGSATFYTVWSSAYAPVPTAVLWILVCLPILVILSFRWFREWSELTFRNTAPSKFPTNQPTSIAVDMDGVLVEQVIPVLNKVRREMGVVLSKSDIVDWEFPFGDTNIKIEIEKAERDEQFVRQMRPYEGAVEALDVLSVKFNVCIATSREPVTDPWSRSWLEKHGIRYKELVNTHREGKSLPGYDLLIDDYIGNIEAFLGNGPPDRCAILFSQPWNQEVGPVSHLLELGRLKIAHGWTEVLALLRCDLHGENDGQSRPADAIGKDYIMMEGLAAFSASSLFLCGYGLPEEPPTDGAGPILHMPGWLYLTLAVGFVVLAFILAAAVFSNPLQRLAERILRVAWLGIALASLGGLITGWLSGIESLGGDTILFRALYFAGFAFILVFSFHIIRTSWRLSKG